MANKKRNWNDKSKVISAIISFGVIVTLAFGIYSVIKSVNKAEENIVNLNDEEIAINEEPKEKETQYRKLEIGDDDIINANAHASMSYDGDGTENMTKEEVTEEIKPRPLTEEEVMANAISNYTFSEDSKLKWPVFGEISLKYSMDNTIFFKSLGKYKTNPGVIIRAERGTNVGASAAGVVINVSDSEETKTTLTVAIGNGYEITYGLLENVILKEGDTVAENQMIGNVAEPTAYYKLEGPGIYMQVNNNRVPVDPLKYLE